MHRTSWLAGWSFWGVQRFFSNCGKDWGSAFLIFSNPFHRVVGIKALMRSLPLGSGAEPGVIGSTLQCTYGISLGETVKSIIYCGVVASASGMPQKGAESIIEEYWRSNRNHWTFWKTFTDLRLVGGALADFAKLGFNFCTNHDVHDCTHSGSTTKLFLSTSSCLFCVRKW